MCVDVGVDVDSGYATRPPRVSGLRAGLLLAALMFAGCQTSASWIDASYHFARADTVSVAVFFDGREQDAGRWLAVLEPLGFEVEAPRLFEADGGRTAGPAGLDTLLVELLRGPLEQLGYATIPADLGLREDRAELCASAQEAGADLLLALKYTLATRWNLQGPRPGSELMRCSGAMILYDVSVFDARSGRRVWGYEHFRPDGAQAHAQYAVELSGDSRATQLNGFRAAARLSAARILAPRAQAAFPGGGAARGR